MTTSDDLTGLGRRIRDARVRAGLTQVELGAPVASGPYLSRIEAGQRRPGPDLLAHIAQRTGTAVETLLGTPEES